MAIPITVIGGYLGAGKTTLVNRLLQQCGGLRLGVLVNDFGEINIDASLIQHHDGQTLTLTNGCVCCAIADDLGAALDTLSTAEIDHVVIETSGVANPAKVAGYGRTWPGFQLGSVVVLADALSIRMRVRDKYVGKLVRQQLEAADFVLATKLDLITEAERVTLCDWLHQQASGLCLIEPQDVLYAVAAPSENMIAPDDESHAAHFATCTLRASQPVDLPALQQAIASWPSAIIRAKGFIYAQQDPECRYLLQGVGRRSSLERHQPWGSLTPETELVLIWRRDMLQETEIADLAHALRAEVDPQKK